MNPRPAAPLTAPDPLEAIGITRIVPVVVIDDITQAAPLAEALLDGGLSCAEITLRTPTTSSWHWPSSARAKRSSKTVPGAALR